MPNVHSFYYLGIDTMVSLRTKIFNFILKSTIKPIIARNTLSAERFEKAQALDKKCDQNDGKKRDSDKDVWGNLLLRHKAKGNALIFNMDNLKEVFYHHYRLIQSNKPAEVVLAHLIQKEDQKNGNS